MRKTSIKNRKANKFDLQPMPSFTRRMPAMVEDLTGYSAILEEQALDRVIEEFEADLIGPDYEVDPLESIDTRPPLPKGPWNKVLTCGHQVRERCGGCGQYQEA